MRCHSGRGFLHFDVTELQIFKGNLGSPSNPNLYSMDILRLTLDFIKIPKIRSLCMEFYGAWQLLAMCHRTLYIRTKLRTFFYKINHKVQDFHCSDLGKLGY